MGHLRRFGCLLVVALALTSCGGGSDDAEAERSATTSAVTEVAPRYDLPFGLEQVAGTRPVGRPAIYDRAEISYDGSPLTARTLQAVYEVVDTDPVAAFRRWVDQVRSLHAGEVTIRRGDELGVSVPEDAVVNQGPLPWLVANGSGPNGYLGAPKGDWINIEMWATDDVPVLLVKVDRFSAERSTTTVHDEIGDDRKPAVVVEGAARHSGDVLLGEQGDLLHLPDGSRTLSHTIPVQSGTGGSYTVLAADDGAEAVRALLAEAATFPRPGNVGEPEVSTVAGSTITLASFVIPAGGWGFEITSVQAPDDDTATIYVRSWAD